jgi:hypothetical protein
LKHNTADDGFQPAGAVSFFQSEDRGAAGFEGELPKVVTLFWLKAAGYLAMKKARACGGGQHLPQLVLNRSSNLL